MALGEASAGFGSAYRFASVDARLIPPVNHGATVQPTGAEGQRMSAPHGPQFDIAVEHAGTTAIVRLAGELDLATAPELTEVLHGLEPACERVILDLTGLQFIDSTGLRLAVTEHGRAAEDGFEFVIAGAAGAVLKVLRLTGLDVTLPLAPDVASILGDASSNGRFNGNL
jgi:anti-sigma B factor antagonist